MPEYRNVFELFSKALCQLQVAVETPPVEPRDLAGIVKSFEFVFELSWKSIQARAKTEGITINSPRSAFTAAFKLGLIKDAEIWAEILEDRNRTVHTYDEEFAKEMCARISARYCQAFEELFALLSS